MTELELLKECATRAADAQGYITMVLIALLVIVLADMMLNMKDGEE